MARGRRGGVEIGDGAIGMSRLPRESEQQMAGLEGWGKLKKKLGLNKLQTRKALKSVNHAVKAVVVPTKKNRKTAEKAVKPHVGKFLAAGDLLIPGAGTAASLAWTKNRMDSVKKKIKAQMAAEAIAARASEAAAAPAAEVATAVVTSVSSGGGGGAISYAAPSEPTPPAAPVAAPVAEEKKTNWLAIGGGTLLAVKALSLVI